MSRWELFGRSPVHAASPAGRGGHVQACGACAVLLALVFSCPRPSQAVEAHMDVYGNVDFTARDEPVSDGTFALGALDLLLTGSASPNVRGLVETVIDSAEGGDFDLELERLSVTYDYRDYLLITAGKLHSPIGFYNTAYHHGTFLETAATRPLGFRFEHRGGILPAHSTGFFLSGTAGGSDGWQWSYDAGVANGRGPTTTHQELIHDPNDWKALLVRLSARPSPIPGLAAGLSAYVDRTPPGDPPDGLVETTDEQLYAAYAVYREAGWEILAEFIALRRLLVETRTRRWSRAGYVQIGHGFGSFTPYVRVEFLDAEEDAYLVQAATPLWARAQRLGCRYDLAPNLALKIEGAADDLRGPRDYRAVTLQAAFTF